MILPEAVQKAFDDFKHAYPQVRFMVGENAYDITYYADDLGRWGLPVWKYLVTNQVLYTMLYEEVLELLSKVTHLRVPPQSLLSNQFIATRKEYMSTRNSFGEGQKTAEALLAIARPDVPFSAWMYLARLTARWNGYVNADDAADYNEGFLGTIGTYQQANQVNQLKSLLVSPDNKQD